MKVQKIINDPVYGFITIPSGILFQLMEHPYFQRLRRIKQLGLTDYVYPGALHTRFHHALGALHLMIQAIEVLKSKGVKITKKEAEAVQIAILLHDIGHGPISHALEHTILNIHHEELSLLFMEELNKEFKGKLSMAIQIFCNKYPKKFLHQLVSSQLDMDRMDYLNRDSYFTGVSEGVIGYDRIIKMLNVKNDQIVVEEKGIYSIEKFLTARRIMYWQVYLHKTVVCAEQMLIHTLKRAKKLALKGYPLNVPESLAFFLYNDFSSDDLKKKKRKIIHHFSLLDDNDIYISLKNFIKNEDKLLSFLSKSLIHRKLFKIELGNKTFNSDYRKKIRLNLQKSLRKTNSTIDAKSLIIRGKETNTAYKKRQDEINILFKKGLILPMSAISEHAVNSKIITKHYLCYPKNII